MSAKPSSYPYHANKLALRIFIRLAGALLLAIATVNLARAGMGNLPLLVLDPLLGIPLRYAALTVGGMELLVALVCLFGKSVGWQAGLIAWLMTNLAVYRVGLFWQGCHTQWGSLGNPLDTLRLFQGSADRGFYLVLVGLWLGSGITLVWLWLSKPKPARLPAVKADEFLKISCPFCGVHIKFSAQNLFQRIPCPQCEKAITLRKPAFLKMACFFCKKHIEFPSHVVGEKMPCPHCNMDITLKEPV